MKSEKEVAEKIGYLQIRLDIISKNPKYFTLEDTAYFKAYIDAIKWMMD